ncbi:MAG: hypothetical protein R6V52_03735 [Bacteroidales bacterium]
MREYVKIFESEKRKICIDKENYSRFADAFESDEKLKIKFRQRADAILRGFIKKDIYEKVKGYKTIWEIKLFKQSKGRNYRFYCKQIETKEKTVYIIVVDLFKKQSQDIPKHIKKKLKKIDQYEYKTQ